MVASSLRRQGHPFGPTETPRGELTVQETAERTGLSEHTLRYYERAVARRIAEELARQT